MRKSLLALVMLLLCACACTGVLAEHAAPDATIIPRSEEMTLGSIKYMFDAENNVIVTGYHGTPVDLVIPQSFGSSWSLFKYIAPGAFAGCETLTSVTIEGGGLLVVDTGAFQGCTNLAHVTLPDYTQEIRENAFYGTGLTEVTLSKEIIAINANAFGACNDLRTITFLGMSLPATLDANAFAWELPNDERTIRCYEGSAVESWAQACGYRVEYLPQGTECTLSISNDGAIYAYSGNMSNLVIPAEIDGIKVRGINNWVFSSNEMLTSVTFPEGLTFIDHDAFPYCANLVEVNFPSTLTHLGSGAFSGCTSLKSITLPEGLQVLEDITFSGCTALESVSLPSTLNHIGLSAFAECVNLKSIVIPEGITTIEESTFYNCTSLESVIIPSTLKRIGMFAFRYTPGLKELMLPDGVERIEFGAFGSCDQLVITIPASVTYIDDLAFTQQQGLKILCHRGSYAAWWAESHSIPFDLIGEGDEGEEGEEDYELLINENGMITGCTGTVKNLVIPAEINGVKVRGIADRAFLENYNITHVELPEGLTSIGYESFALCENLVSIKLPSTLNTISPYAFNLCKALENIVIPEGVTALEDGTFYCCYHLKSISLPSTLKTIGNSVFDSNNVLLRVDLPEGLTSIGSSAFAWSALKIISIPDSVVDIQESAFYRCENVTIVCSRGSAAEAFALAQGMTIQYATTADGTPYESPDGDYTLYINGNGVITAFEGMPTELVIPDEINGIPVTGIADSVFYMVSSLESMQFPGSMTFIGDNAFYRCQSLSHVQFGEGLTDIGDNAFYGCNELTSLALPGALKTIGDYAFCSTGFNGDLTLPDGLTSIGAHAFDGAELEHITIPISVTHIGESPFNKYRVTIYCYRDSYAVQWAKQHGVNFRYINEDGTIEDYTLITDGVGFISGYTGTPEDIIITTDVAANAFKNCASLKSITLSNVTTIGESAFENCVNLEEVVAADEWLSYINASAFAGCTSLKEFPFSKETYMISDSAFRGAGLTQAVIPAGVEYIGSRAFQDCPLTSIVFKSMTLPSMDTNTFWPAGVQTVPCTIHCYEGSAVEAWAQGMGYPIAHLDETGDYTLYINADGVITGYEGFFVKLVIPDEVNGIPVTGIGDYAFFGAENLRSITLPEVVTSIGNFAFAQCYSLAEINLPDSLTYIGEDAFGYTAITSVVIPDGVTKLAPYTFTGCNQLTSVTLPDQLTSIGDYAFANCVNLSSISIPHSVQTIGQYAFYDCFSLTSVTVPKGVTSIGDHVFGFCSNLEKITLHPDLEHIGAYAFEQCISLVNVYIPKTVTHLEEGVFKDCWSLKHVNLSHNLISLGDWAFAHCYSLNKVVLPNNLETIGKHAFYWSGMDMNSRARAAVSRDTALGGLGCIVIPASVEHIGEAAFDGCPNLKISCYRDSYAAQYAQELGIGIIYVDECAHVEEILPAVDSTCLSIGLTEGTQCALCGIIMVAQEEIPLHALSTEVLSALAPTCTTDGLTEGKHCVNCGEVFVEQEIIPATGHWLTITKDSFELKEGDALTLADFAEGCVHLDEFIFTGIASDETKLAVVDNKLCALDVGFAGMQLNVTLSDDFCMEVIVSAIIHAHENMTLPADLTEVGEEAFVNTAAEEFILQEDVATIGPRAFADSQVKLISIPASVVEITPDAFEGCDVIFIVSSGSYAESFAQEYRIPYITQ